MVIANLHAFEGDLEFIKQHAKPLDKRAGYNFGAMG
jgi:hypothetical protein